MCSRFRFGVIAMGVILAAGLSPSAARAAGGKPVAYFYNQSDSAAPVSVAIKGKATVNVKPVAPGHVSAAVSLPKGVLSAAFSSPAMKKEMQSMGMPAPRNLHITFRSHGRSTKLGQPLQASLLDKSHVRTLIYFMRVAKPGAAPSPMDSAAVAIYDSDYKAAAQGKALVAIFNETGTERLKFGAAHFDVWFRTPDGGGSDESNNGNWGLVTPEEMKPGHYDLVNTPAGDQDAVTLKALKQAKPIGTLTPADIRPGHIVIYLIRRPGKLERVMDISGS